MIMAFILSAVAGVGPCPPQAPPINPRFNTKAVYSSLINCPCISCQCPNCDCAESSGNTDNSRPIVTQPATRMVMRRVIVGYQTRCSRFGCEQVPVYANRYVEE